MDYLVTVMLTSWDSEEDRARFSHSIPIAVSGPTREARWELLDSAIFRTLEAVAKRGGVEELDRYLKSRNVLFDIRRAGETGGSDLGMSGQSEGVRQYVLAGSP